MNLCLDRLSNIVNTAKERKDGLNRHLSIPVFALNESHIVTTLY